MDFRIGICLLLTLSTGLGDDDDDESTREVIFLNDEDNSYTWKAMDNPSIYVTADDGYQIQVNVTELNVDGENGDFVTIQMNSGDDDDDEDIYSNTLIFTYTVQGEPSYLFNNNNVTADFTGSSADTAFEIKFIRVGEATTTTPQPSSTSTTEAMPTPDPEESAILVVYLYGQPPKTYKDKKVIETLKEAIAQMGTEYCKAQSCPLNNSISNSNVKIDLLEACPLAWENNDNCAQLTFALPIVKAENASNLALWDGYQLNEPHLRNMWSTYAEEVLKESGLDIFHVPNVRSIFVRRIIIISSVTVVLIVLILSARAIGTHLAKKSRRLSETFSIVSNATNQTTRSSLNPHYLQELPPFFSSDFPMYNDHKSTHNHFNDYNENMQSLDDEAPAMIDISNDDLGVHRDAEA